MKHPVRHSCLLIIFLGLVAASCSNEVSNEIDLSGEWRFEMDSLDNGIDEQWYERELAGSINLPGSMASNGVGPDVGFHTHWTGTVADRNWFENEHYQPYLGQEQFLFPFWLIPEQHYYGAAWYQREIQIPANWAGENISLLLERCHWETRVWVDGQYAGMQNSLGTPHTYDLTPFLEPGNHTLTICIDNRVKEINVGVNSHSISDHTQSNWNGVVGDLKLFARSPIAIVDVQVYPDVQKKTAGIEVTLANTTGFPAEGTIQITAVSEAAVSDTAVSGAAGQSVRVPAMEENFRIREDRQSFIFQYPMGDNPLLWDEFQPNLYNLQLRVDAGGMTDEKTVRFGMREFRADGSRFAINGRPVFLRGTLECAIFPDTGYPPMDAESWSRIFRVCRDHGLNHLRFHSWCPPEAAFEAADEMGFYLQVECSSWANVRPTVSYSAIGDGMPLDQWLYEESERMVRAYGNHPSFCMMAYGNEPGGENRATYLAEFVSFWKDRDGRRVYTGGAGWPVIPENEFHVVPQPRIQRWGEGLNSLINAEPPATDYDWTDRMPGSGQPVVSHEIGQWCVYPNLREVAKYDGVLKATNFEIFRRSLEAHGLIHLADSFLLASGKLQALCYKADIEAALRTPGFAGFQLLDLHDFPGQGTALVGVLDPFWEEKGYISPEEYRRFCNETVPLARFEKRIFESGEPISVGIEIAHFGPSKLESVTPEWRIRERDGRLLHEGTLPQTDVPWGNGIPLGGIHTSIERNTALQLELEVEVAGFANSWDFWVYPAEKPEAGKNVLIVQELDPSVISTLEEGGKVLLSIPQGRVRKEMGGDIGIAFSPIFWNTAWTDNQKPHTLGILCNPEHPALEAFPTGYHSNWQWWDACTHSSPLIIEHLSGEIQPIVRVIDDWVSNRDLALLFEAKVGNGKLLVTGIDLINGAADRPEARQLLYSLKNYMSGAHFNPTVELGFEEIRGLMN